LPTALAGTNRAILRVWSFERFISKDPPMHMSCLNAEWLITFAVLEEGGFWEAL
jgi:hypothetical protein